RDAGPADLTYRPRIVRVETELCREVERRRQPGLSASQQVAEPRIRLLGRAEARVLPDRPRPSAVHRRVRPAGEREFAGEIELEPGDVVGRVDRLDLDPGVGLAPFVRRRHALILRPGLLRALDGRPAD